MTTTSLKGHRAYNDPSIRAGQNRHGRIVIPGQNKADQSGKEQSSKDNAHTKGPQKQKGFHLKGPEIGKGGNNVEIGSHENENQGTGDTGEYHGTDGHSTANGDKQILLSAVLSARKIVTVRPDVLSGPDTIGLNLIGPCQTI